MDELRKLVAGVQSDCEDIIAELDTADKKGVFSYPRSKGVRKAALEIAKKAKALREVSQDTFKKTEGASEAE